MKSALVSLIVLLLTTPPPTRAETGDQILAEIKAIADARQSKDETQKGTMTIVDGDGSKRVREVVIRSKNYGNRSRKSVTFFLAPPELKDVGVLSWTYPDKEDDQWIYFPETERIRRLSTDLAKQDFGDSDFSYEDSKLLNDLLLDPTKMGTATLARDNDTIDGVPCVVLDFKVARDDSEYGRLVLWIHRADATLRKMELYDQQGGALRKVLTVSDYTTIDGIPTPHIAAMATLSKGSKTSMEFLETHYNQGLGDDFFTQRALQRGPS